MKMQLLILVFLLGCVHLKGAEAVANNPQKDFILSCLQKLCLDQKRSGTNHFFALRTSKGDWIFWREGRLLWKTDLNPYFESPGPAELRARAVWDTRLLFPNRLIRLDKDVVPVNRDPNKAVFTDQKDYVADLVYECVLNGELIEMFDIPSLTPDLPANRISPPAAVIK